MGLRYNIYILQKGENVMKKMNNKGFSLVELIVVVLIMAIIAVALAPQVMKWVENSRKSNDIENYNAIVEAANVAGTNEDVIKDIGNSGTVTIKFGETGVSMSGSGNATLQAQMIKTLPDLTGTETQSSWAGSDNQPPFELTVNVTKEGIKVTKTKAPEKDFS